LFVQPPYKATIPPRWGCQLSSTTAAAIHSPQGLTYNPPCRRWSDGLRVPPVSPTPCFVTQCARETSWFWPTINFFLPLYKATTRIESAQPDMAAPPLPATALSANDRRKIQNRMAQRRFRRTSGCILCSSISCGTDHANIWPPFSVFAEKRAIEKRPLNGQDASWHDDPDGGPPFTITIHGDTVAPRFNTGPNQRSASCRASALNSMTQSREVPPRGTGQMSEQEASTWENQLFGDMFGLGNASADLVVAPFSPPNSNSSTPPGQMSGPPAAASWPASQSGDGSMLSDSIDDGSMLQAIFPAGNMDAAVLGVISGNSARPPARRTAEELRSALRAELSAAWKLEKHPHPTWSKGQNDPWEPLIHTAARRGNCGILKMLHGHKADINERDGEGRTALHLAIEYQQEEAIMWLLENGVDINAYDNLGRTALSMAVNNGCEAGVRLFLLHGADPTLRIQEGTTRPNSVRSDRGPALVDRAVTYIM
jgi:hypothetical protein